MFRPTMILIALLVASLSLTLFVVKYQVQDLEEQLVDLNRSITDDRQAIHVLKAEWSHLNAPTRLKGLAERHLGLNPVEPEQVGTADEMLDREPTLEAQSGDVAPLPAEMPKPTPIRDTR